MTNINQRKRGDVGCFIALFFILAFLSGSSVADSLAILEFELHDLTLNPDTAGETQRVATLRPLLAESLEKTYSHTIKDNPESAKTESAKGRGYVFDRPEVAARIASDAGAEWVISGRLHKASFLFVYLKAQLIKVSSGKVVADFVVEIKGRQKKLTTKGIDALALQIHDALKQVNIEKL